MADSAPKKVQPQVALTPEMVALKDFLQRMGRAVEIPRSNRVVAKGVTAFGEESHQYNVASEPDDHLYPRIPNLLGHKVVFPEDPSEFDHVQYLSDFFDSTVQAKRFVTDELSNETFQRERSNFVPQRVRMNGFDTKANSLEAFRSWLDNDSRNLLAILAPAGYGKTALTCEATHELGMQYLARYPGGNEPFPFRIPFGKYRRASDFESMILRALQDKNVTDYTPTAFAFLVDHRRTVLILDGFDELLEERPEEAKKNLRVMVETLGQKGKVVITARSTFFRTSEQVADFLEYGVSSQSVDVMELLSFNQLQRRELIKKRCDSAGLGQRDITRVASFIDSPELEEPLGSPLLLNETINLLLEEDKEIRLDRKAGRRDLFGALESSVYDRERRRHSHDFTDQEQQAFLRRLAGEMLKENERGYDKGSTDVVASEALDDFDREIEGSEVDLLVDHHFLDVSESELDPEERPIYFNHQLFREYFQAMACIDASRGDGSWLLPEFLQKRPLPEEVAQWCADLDSEESLPTYLLQALETSESLTSSLVENIGAVCVSYGNPQLLRGVLEVTPPDIAIRLRLTDLELGAQDLAGRMITQLDCTNCDLTKVDLSECMIGEFTLNRCRVAGLSVIGAHIDSAAFDFGEREFDSPAILKKLELLGAVTGVKSAEQRKEIEEDQTRRVHKFIVGRVRRFYVPGPENNPAGSKWKNEIVEKNVFGGLEGRDSERKWAKSTVVPALLTEEVLTRRKVNGEYRYRVAEIAEDDARALIERGELIGRVEKAATRIERRSSSQRVTSR